MHYDRTQLSQVLISPDCVFDASLVPKNPMADGPSQPDWSGLNRKDQEALAARAACWLTICSFIFCCISLGVGCAMWVATIQV